jgi:hypothetical protein
VAEADYPAEDVAAEEVRAALLWADAVVEVPQAPAARLEAVLQAAPVAPGWQAPEV